MGPTPGFIQLDIHKTRDIAVREFKEMMREAREEPGVITACTWEGREELLTNFFTEIELCEKALNEYLQQKKKIFARFYFVSD